MGYDDEKPSAKERILYAYISLTDAEGCRSATIQKVAQQAKVNRVTVYRHFATTEEMLEERIYQSMKKSLEASVKSQVCFDELTCRNLIDATHCCIHRIDMLVKNDGATYRYIAYGSAKSALMDAVAEIMHTTYRRRYSILDSTLLPLAAGLIFDFCESRKDVDSIADFEALLMARTVVGLVEKLADELIRLDETC